MDNADSPVFRSHIMRKQELPQSSKDQNRVQNSQDSWKTPPSTIADSQPEPDRPVAATSSPSRVWEVFLKQIENPEVPSPASGNENKENRPDPSPELPYGRLEILSSTSAIITSETSSISRQPSSPSPTRKPKSSPERVLEMSNHNLPSTQDPAATLKRKRLELTELELQTSSSAPSKLAIKSSITSSSFEQTPKRQCLEDDQVEVTQTRIMTSSKATEVAIPSAANLTSVWAEKHEIRPPPPRTSTKDLTVEKLITPSLLNLTKKMPFNILYQPREQKRELRPMERGYWLLNCQGWDTRLRDRCWECLGNFIGKSYGGWGVWCVRDEQFEKIKVYCWGAVVEHTFLLLYMASESKIKISAARWIGGNGQAVIIMPL
jgi:hypothetical protein